MSSTNEPPYSDDPERHLPPHHNPLPELTDADTPAKHIAQAEFERVHQSEDFTRLQLGRAGAALLGTAQAQYPCVPAGRAP